MIGRHDHPKRVSEERPRKTYTTRAYFSGESIPEKHLGIPLTDSVTLQAECASHGKLAIINNGNKQKFRVCERCGYAVPAGTKVSSKHKNAFGNDCSGQLNKVYDLGHEYQTDILKLEFEGYSNKDLSFWLSLLYALLDGLEHRASGSTVMILMACSIQAEVIWSEPALILFDDVPGGAGRRETSS